jgi:hypothetical protein
VIGGIHTRCRDFCAAEPAQGHDGIDAAGRLPHGVDAAEKDQSVVRVDGERAGIPAGGVIDRGAAGPPVWPGLAVAGAAQREGDQVPAAKAGPAVQDAPPRQRDRGGAPPGAEQAAGDRRDRVRVASAADCRFQGVLEVLGWGKTRRTGRRPVRGSG